MRLTLAEVVSEEEFRLVLRSGSPAALTRPVAGAETVEADRPEELTARDYIMLTTGVRLRGNPELQRQLVVESQARGVAALGFGVGLVFRSIPRALLEEARARDFPVFEVPFEVPFRDIIASINRSHLSDDFSSLKRTVALQNTLLGAMGESRPEDALVGRLATIVGGAVLFRPGGAVVADAGAVPVAAIWDEIARRGGCHDVFEAGGAEVAASPIMVEGEVRFWLALAGRPGEVTSVLAGPVVEVAERLLRLIDLARDVRVMEERVRRGELLNDLLDERRAREVSPERLELFGFGAKGPWRVALLAVSADRDEAMRLVANSAASTGTPHLLGLHHDHVALVVEGDCELLEAWTANLAAAGLPVRAALGRAVETPSRLVDSRCDALLALDFLDQTGAAAGRVLRFEHFELIDALLSAADRAELRARVDLVLEPLRDHPQLLETLVAYLSADQNVNAAAEALHVHPNSLRYRLGRVEELLGRSVRSPATLADLYVALRAETRFGPL
ncbi:MAG TPA: helix-turn-helix domain-containing protein [Acidimicrobiia bacterium]|nr:helix-turn-helix domain-containing protein [Acidimicrobiia bacterium]